MLRLSNLALPLDYTEASLAAAVAKKCGITPDLLLSCIVVRRSVDARKKDDVHFVLTVHLKVRNETVLLKKYRFLSAVQGAPGRPGGYSEVRIPLHDCGI